MDFFTRVLDRFTPWDRGGEVQRRKKREDEQNNYSPPQASATPASRPFTPSRPSAQTVSVEGDEPTPEKPENRFGSLNKNLVFNKPNNFVDVANRSGYKPVPALKPGTVVKPSAVASFGAKPSAPTEDDINRKKLDDGLDAGKSWEQIAKENNFKLEGVRQYSQATRPNYGIKLERPSQSIFDKIIRDRFDANTEADKFRRQEGNALPGAEQKPLTLDAPGNIIGSTPIIGQVVKMLNTGQAQIAQINNSVEAKFLTDRQLKLQQDLLAAQKNGDKEAYYEAVVQLDFLSSRIEAVLKAEEEDFGRYRKNDGGLFNTGTLYDGDASRKGDLVTGLKDIALPTAVAGLDLLTLGYGSTVGKAVASGGVRAIGSKTVAPTVAKLFGGNFASGSLNAAANDASLPDALKAGVATSVLGSVPDVALPGIGRAIKSRFFPKGLGKGARAASESIDNAAIDSSVESLLKDIEPKPITVRKNIPIDGAPGKPVDIPVRTTPEPQGNIIREIGGDAPNVTRVPSVQDVANQRVTRNFADQPRVRPDSRIEGVGPRKVEKPFSIDSKAVSKAQNKIIDDYADSIRELGEGNGVAILPDGRRVSNNARPKSFGPKKATKSMWRNEAERQLMAGEAEPGVLRAFNDAADPEIQSLLARGERPTAPDGRSITVKKSSSISVSTDNVTVPKNLPETPGKVRVTTQTSPNKVKSAEVAAESPLSRIMADGRPANRPIPMGDPANPNNLTKRQVKSERNQAKLARQVAKAQDDTAESLAQINKVKTPAKSTRQPGLIKSGKFKKGRRGPYETVTQVDQKAAARVDSASKSTRQVIDETKASVKETGQASAQDVANMEMKLSDGSVVPKTPEYKELSKLYWEAGTNDAQSLALRNKSLKKSGSGRQIANRAVSKLHALVEDTAKISDEAIAKINKTADKFAEFRDSSNKAYNDFNANATKANRDNYIRLNDEFSKAEKDMAMAQYDAAKGALKGNTNVKLKRMIEDAAQDADIYTMDYVDAALLSSTGTFVRNFINAGLGSLEEGAFGGVGARIGRAISKTPVGGGVGRGSLEGFGRGASNIVDASKIRAKGAGWNPIEHMKNWSTTGNQLGDSWIEGSTYRSMLDHYKQVLKKQGYIGDELKWRTDVMARQDPEKLAQNVYGPSAKKAAGLGSGIAKRSSFERKAQREIADGIAKLLSKEQSQGGEFVAKAITRIVLGYPSAIGRALLAGADRSIPFVNSDTIKALTAGSSEARGVAIKESIKKSGTAVTALAVFQGLGANGRISGAYPDDQDTRDKWKREGIKENSIKIGDGWYDVPTYMGSFAIPALTWAAIGRNGGITGGGLGKESLSEVGAIVGSMDPTENVGRISQVLSGRSDANKFAQRTVASAGRMATPYGSLLNQLSKVFDPTQNDTTDDNFVAGTLKKIIDGIPIADKGLPDKVDKEGNTLTNPSVFQTMIGSNSAVQKGGVERSKEIDSEINSILKTIDKYGVMDDKNILAALEGTSKEAYDKAQKGGKQLDESEIKALQKGLVRGVSSEGTDTVYLEKGQYASNVAVLKMKRDLMESDPTTKPSSMLDIEEAITRGEYYEKNKTSYKDITLHKKTSLSEWRKMGDPESDEYDPDNYQKLWELDQALTDKGVSYNTDNPEKNKYYVKEKGKGGRGSKKFSTDFGKLKAGAFAPRVKAYDTIDVKTGVIPRISVKRPNIVHRVGKIR